MNIPRYLGRASLAVVITGALLGASGCAASSQFMAPSPRATIAATGDAATVVFVRPAYYASSVKVHIIDGKGRFLGDSTPESYFTVKVPAGEHTFIGVSDITSPMKATVAAGKVYYVHVVAREGNFSPRFQLLAVTQRSSHYGTVDEWLAKANSYTPDEKAGQDHLASHAQHVEKKIAEANQVLASYDAEQLAARTLAAEDGKVTPGIEATAPVATPAAAPVADPAAAPPASTPAPAPAPAAPPTP